ETLYTDFPTGESSCSGTIPSTKQTPPDNAHEVVYTVNLQLPQFNHKSLDLWFAIAKADFGANRITSDAQKYVQLLKALPYQIAEQLQDILQKLLNERVVGDKRPSQLLREMRVLAQDSVQEDVLHQLWTERLPPKIRPLLIISENLGLNELAVMADRLVDNLDLLPVMAVHGADTTGHDKHSGSITTPQTERQLLEINTALKDCQNCLANLQVSQQLIQKQLYEMQSQQQQQQQNINQLQNSLRYENRARSRRRSLAPNRNGTCYYHTKWGNDAHRCTLPCNFKSSANNQGN
ncbi:PREDICTED: uncharacterized protein LOC107070923, partial [Polistes dominula]|uniref:Uncharacterized protein LOC107070923 n=1 Tax=Polistes dominula TaxID=743375 RepID=A0ABM1IXN0_POLDO